MGFYKSPEEMYASRAIRYKREADRHWALAKNGDGDFHYGKARLCYEQARVNREKAVKAHETGAVFAKRAKR